MNFKITLKQGTSKPVCSAIDGSEPETQKRDNNWNYYIFADIYSVFILITTKNETYIDTGVSDYILFYRDVFVSAGKINPSTCFRFHLY